MTRDDIIPEPMIPTPKLRFVERVTHRSEWAWQTEKILQQWWQGGAVINVGFGDVPVGAQVGEWRDVQVASEQEGSR